MLTSWRANHTPQGQTAEACTYSVCMPAINHHPSQHSFEHSDLLLKERSMVSPDFSSLKKQFSTGLGFFDPKGSR